MTVAEASANLTQGHNLSILSVYTTKSIIGKRLNIHTVVHDKLIHTGDFAWFGLGFSLSIRPGIIIIHLDLYYL